MAVDMTGTNSQSIIVGIIFAYAYIRLKYSVLQ